MTTEELLKPRYKVIADWPGSLFRIGDLFHSIEGPAEVWESQRGGNKFLYNPSNFPALFKRLEWWEDREDLSSVTFLKDIGDGEIFQSECLTNGMCYVKPNKKSDGDLRYTNLKHFLPATESEYQSFIQR